MPSDPIARVARAAIERRRAEHGYASAIVAAVEALEVEGVRRPFAQVAAAAGVSRQAVRQLVERARA